MGRYFRNEFGKLREEIEQPDYFREKLLYNYLYKGPVLEWYMRIKTRLEKNYLTFHELVPRKATVLDIGCGYGFMSYMLAFTSEERTITGIDYDEDKIQTAQHCFSKTNNINFVYANVMEFEFEKYDCIIMADILHYLQPDEQRRVIEKCISKLNEGGVVIIREGDKEMSKGHRRTRLSEFFSTKVLNFNKTKTGGLSFLSGSMIKTIATEKNMDCREMADSKVTSNTIFILKHK